MAGDLLNVFLTEKWFLVFFVYGLAFFLMGFSIALNARRPTTFRLGRHLWLLACFGILHGIAEWVYIFFPPSQKLVGWETLTGTVLNSGHGILVSLSFVFLFAFGGSLLAGTMGWKQWIRWVPALLMAVWLWVFILERPQQPEAITKWLTLSEVTSRYFLALPGSILTAIGFYLQCGEIRGLRHPPLERVLFGSAAVFAVYALAGGLVVPEAHFFPANFINTSFFMEIGLPVQLLRAVSGIFMAYFVIRSLDLYEIENRNRLEALRDRELIWLERDRIRRDLHDGVIQAIYGLSLGLDHASSMIEKDPVACAGRLKELGGRADSVISELRGYLKEMKPSYGLPGNAVLILEDLLAGFTASAGLVPDFRCRGIQESDMSDTQRDHFYHMVKEILSNIQRHSEAKMVYADLDLGSGGLRLTISDDGIGFPESKIFSGKMGLTNMYERAALAGGLVDVKSAGGRGTEVTLWLPYESS